MKIQDNYLSCIIGDLIEAEHIKVIGKSAYSLVSELTVFNLITYFDLLYSPYKKKTPADKCQWMLKKIHHNYKLKYLNDNNI